MLPASPAARAAFLFLAVVALLGPVQAQASTPKASYTICVEGPVSVVIAGSPVAVSARICASVSYYPDRGPSAALLSLSPAWLPASIVNKMLNDALEALSDASGRLDVSGPAGVRYVYVARAGPVVCNDTYWGAGEGVVEALLLKTWDGDYLPARLVIQAGERTVKAELTYLDEPVCGREVLTPAYRATLAGLALAAVAGGVAAAVWRFKRFTLRSLEVSGEIGGWR